MIPIKANTKIAALLKQHPDALEAIISISPKFNKLRNPLLRKIMASRTTISMASKVGGCTVDDFFKKLQPLGFIIDKTAITEDEQQSSPLPDFMKNISPANIIQMDVRPVLDGGKDPFNLILEKLNYLQPEQILKLINSFEPIPLIELLGKKGFETYSEIVNENLVNTYFVKNEKSKIYEPSIKNDVQDWEAILKQFENKIKTIDVRELQMPLPMLTILDELEKLPAGNALFVYHKRIPVFLLQELQDRKFEYRIKEIGDADVHLLIFKS